MLMNSNLKYFILFSSFGFSKYFGTWTTSTLNHTHTHTHTQYIYIYIYYATIQFVIICN